MYNKSNESSPLGVFAAGLALGGIIGAGVALLLAPQSGEEARSMIAEKSNDLKGQVSDKVNEAREVAQQQVDTAKQQFESMR
jgi:gas vesicle protein